MKKITKSHIRMRLDRLGVPYGIFDKYCNFEHDFTRRFIKGDTLEPMPKIALDKLDVLENEVEQLTLAATDAVLENSEDGKETLVFVPYFINNKTYHRAGYSRAYGYYSCFVADVKNILNRVRYVEQNIMCFTPDTLSYTDDDVFYGHNKDANKVILDPLRLRKKLNLRLGDYKMTKNEKDLEIQKEMQNIMDAVTVEIVEYTRLNGGVPPKRVLIPRYLDRREYEARHPKLRDPYIYNIAVTRASEELDAKAAIFDEGYHVYGCDPKELNDPQVDVLAVDVLGVCYDAK